MYVLLFITIVVITLTTVKSYTFPTRLRLNKRYSNNIYAETGKVLLKDDDYVQKLFDMICQSYEAIMVSR